MPNPRVLYLPGDMFISTTDYTFLKDWGYACLIAIMFPAKDMDPGTKFIVSNENVNVCMREYCFCTEKIF